MFTTEISLRYSTGYFAQVRGLESSQSSSSIQLIAYDALLHRGYRLKVHSIASNI